MILSFDIGGTFVKYGLMNMDGSIVEKGQVPTSPSGDSIIHEITLIKKQFEQHPIKAVGVSAPGVVNSSGYMITGGAIQDFFNFDMKATLESKLNVPVFVENDGNCAALAEKWIGNSKDHQHSVVIVVGTGIGGGIIINDRLYSGAHYTAAEFGFIITDTDQKETHLQTLSYSGSVQSGFINRYFSLSNNPDTSLKGLEIFKLSQEGDVHAQQAYQEFIHFLAMGVFSIIVSLDPGIVLIGGAISSNDTFIEDLNKAVLNIKNSHIGMGNITFPEINRCMHKNDAGILGAAYLAIQNI